MRKIIMMFSVTILVISTMLCMVSCSNSSSSKNNDNVDNISSNSNNNSTNGTPTVGDNNNVTKCSHIWQVATCTAPKTCSICNQTEGNALGHTWANATCTAPKTCSVCNQTEGNALGHTWVNATCSVPKTCSVCGETEGNIGDHADAGNGECKYCNQDILLLELQKGFSVQLIVPTIGGMNGYCTVKYTNNTKYTISGDMTWLSANGKLLYNSSAEFTLQPGYYVTKTHFRAVIESDRYNSKYKDLYLDNDSLAYTNVYVNGKKVFVRFGVNGPVAFGYSLDEIGVY